MSSILSCFTVLLDSREHIDVGHECLVVLPQPFDLRVMSVNDFVNSGTGVILGNSPSFILSVICEASGDCKVANVCDGSCACMGLKGHVR
jgi:hypothetical protein